MRHILFPSLLLAVVVVAESWPSAQTSAGAQTPAQAQTTGQTAVAAQPSLPTLTCSELATALTRALANDVRAKDWANLARYRMANRTTKDTQVVFMGDSITDNWQQPRFGDFFPDRNYADRGISGQTTPQMLVRFIPDVIELRPKVVVILAGTNDIAGNTGVASDEEIMGNLAAMSDLAHAHGIKVVMSSITPVSNYHAAQTPLPPQTLLRPMSRIKAINDWMQKYTRSHGDVYLDYFSAMVDASGLLKAEFSADDLHPNAAGYAVMAPLAEAAIATALR